MILQNHRRVPVSIFIVKIAALGSLKRVTGRIFMFEQVISKEQAKTLSLIFHQLRNKIFLNLSAHVQKVPFYWYKPSKQIHVSLDTIPLKRKVKKGGRKRLWKTQEMEGRIR